MGTDLMNFGLATQAAAMGDANALMGIGTQQQGMNQANLDLAYQDFVKQQDYPWQQLDRWSAVLAGKNVPSYQSSSSSNVSSGSTLGGLATPSTYGAPTYGSPAIAGIQGFGGTYGALSSAF
jgi:uncharacterized membrane protein